MIWLVLGTILGIILISVLIFQASNKKAYRNHYSSDRGFVDSLTGDSGCDSSSGSDSGSCGGSDGGGGGD